jgi:2-(1,2-epoxy-1,2-dihydrophenyl)acetyl-CoA isomerase
VPEAELESASRRLGARLASLPPGVANEFKRVLNDVGLPRFDRAVELETQAQRALQERQVAGEQGTA